MTDEDWDFQLAKLALSWPALHRALVASITGEFSWLNDTARARLLVRALCELGLTEVAHNMNGIAYVQGHDEVAEMVVGLRRALFRAFPRDLNGGDLTMGQITEMQNILGDAKMPGVDRDLMKRIIGGSREKGRAS